MEDVILEEFERVYSRVVEKFPEIKKEELKLKHMDDFEYVSFLMIDDKKYLEENKIVIDPSMIVGAKFLEFSEEEKEASIAHELGHYTRYKKSSPKKVGKSILYAYIMSVYANSPEMWQLEEMDSNIRHKMKRVKKWHFMQEVYADNRAIEAGYGKVLINVLTRHLKKYSMAFAPVQRDEMIIRINNLEGKISQRW